MLEAFQAFLLGQGGVLAMGDDGADDEATRQMRTVTRVITESPALLARERQVMARYEDALASLIAADVGAGPEAVEPRAAANALVGLHRALIAYVRERVAGGASASQIRRGVRTQAKRAFARLEDGLGEYAVKA